MIFKVIEWNIKIKFFLALELKYGVSISQTRVLSTLLVKVFKSVGCFLIVVQVSFQLWDLFIKAISVKLEKTFRVFKAYIRRWGNLFVEFLSHAYGIKDPWKIGLFRFKKFWRGLRHDICYKIVTTPEFYHAWSCQKIFDIILVDFWRWKLLSSKSTSSLEFKLKRKIIEIHAVQTSISREWRLD